MVRAARLPLRLRMLALLLASVAGLGVAGHPASADAPEATRTAARTALAQLSSPLLEARQAAVQRLVALLPDARPQVIESLAGSPWVAQLHLIEVLSRDGGPEALDALVRHLVRADETQAQRIRVSLAEDPSARDRLLAAFRQDAAGFARAAGTTRGGQRRLRELLSLLQRAEIEARFVARKSRSGSTGYYKGQYEHLRGADREAGYRALALEVVTGVALDEAIPTPGVYRTGVYRFLHEHTIDEWELRSMALNAVAELCTPQDELVVERLEISRTKLGTRWLELDERLRQAGETESWNSKVFQDAFTDWEDCVGEYADQVACLYQIVPERYDDEIEILIQRIRDPDLYAVTNPSSMVAALLIRVGWYERAVDAYRESMRRNRGSPALGFYNQACAYAGWSQKVGLSRAAQESKLDQAIMCLELSVERGWSDVDWMNEDRDLDPLRAHRKQRYDVLVERIRKEFELPPK